MIRVAEQTDIEGIMSLCRTFSYIYDTPRPSETRGLELMKTVIDAGSAFVDEVDGHLYGCIGGCAMPHPFLDYTVLACMFVYSSGGNGTGLIRRFIRHGRELGVDAINASTHAQVNSERDCRLMSLLGFKVTETGWHLNL